MTIGPIWKHNPGSGLHEGYAAAMFAPRRARAGVLASRTATPPVPAFVLGGSINALAVVRSLGRKGIPVRVVPDREFDVAIRSKYATELEARRGGPSDETLVARLVASAQATGTRPVLFVTTDRDLLLVARHRERFAEAFRFDLPERETVETAADKALFAEFADRHGLPVPGTEVLRSREDAVRAADLLRFPVVLKPNLSFAWPARGRKIVLAANATSLVAQWEALRGTCDCLIAQELIESPDSEHFAFCAYRSADHEELASITIRKLRVLPIHGGAATFLQTISDPALEAAGRKTLAALGYTGAASVCFKTDLPTGRHLIHEVNGRLPAWHGAFALAGIDLPHLIYRELLGERGLPATPATVGGKWVAVAGDIAACRDYRRSGELGLGRWLASLRGVGVWAELARDDPRGLLDLARRAALSARHTHRPGG